MAALTETGRACGWIPLRIDCAQITLRCWFGDCGERGFAGWLSLLHRCAEPPRGQGQISPVSRSEIAATQAAKGSLNGEKQKILHGRRLAGFNEGVPFAMSLWFVCPAGDLQFPLGSPSGKAVGEGD